MTMMARDDNGVTVQAMRPGTNQKLVVSSSSVQSSAMGATTRLIRVLALGADVRIVIGLDPTADANSMPVLAGSPEYFQIGPGEKVAAIRKDSADAELNITEGANF